MLKPKTTEFVIIKYESKDSVLSTAYIYNAIDKEFFIPKCVYYLQSLKSKKLKNRLRLIATKANRNRKLDSLMNTGVQTEKTFKNEKTI